ncbi:MAG TPA: CCA tRNA nucleotidyltransferase [Terracidiphilus sp.]|nr:CCA tRNA nucleotidyltransferase [Terracidiphilus sp.]
MPAPSRQFEAALRILETLRAEGHLAYLAGGCVRDLLLGRTPLDYDVATSATPDIVLNLFPRTFAVGAHFGVVLVADETLDETPPLEDAPDSAPRYSVTEVATFRCDGAYSDGRHPDAVRYTQSPEQDVQRRDFTINGLLLDPTKLLAAEPSENLDGPPENLDDPPENLDGPPENLDDPPENLDDPPQTRRGTTFSRAETAQKTTRALAPEPSLDPQLLRSAVLDHVGGLADLDTGVIRAIGDPHRRFQEDQLRLLRAVRFAARFGYTIETATFAAIRHLAPRIHAVSRERVRDEFSKMLTEGRARRAFELLDETDLLVQVLPEISNMKGVQQPPQFHPEGDVFIHTMLLLQQLPPRCPRTLAWGALLHDVGKPPTFRVAPDRIRFDGHVEVGVAMAAEILRRFRFSNEDTRQILSLVENHMRFADAPRMKASTLKRFFRLPCFEEHLELHRMDCLAAHANLEIYNNVNERYHSIAEEEFRPRPLLTGDDLIAAGYAPGPQFKEMLQAAEDAQLEGTIATLEEALALIRERFAGAGPA